ncbi:Regulatory protein recX [Morus notabilis]|uniref:Regulatory protein RecX n=1 Tax=Morus notabilis TaxID=981085 RepID=W9RVE2_9ROSA|nr:uncharacterized protein LOC21403124 [Morus notabilis]EXB97667.1 Regulatory protein recX [Morus notabilis]
MTISAGSISFISQFQVQCRAFLIPWVKNKGAITCLRNRDYSSSVPVRYIPKKSSQSNKLDGSEPMKVSEKREFCEFPQVSPLSNDELSHGGGTGNVVKKSFNFDMKPQYQSPMLLSNLHFNDAEQDDIMEEPAEIAEDDYALEEPEEVAEELSIHQQNGCFEPDVLQPLGNKTKQDAENMAVKLLAARAFTAVELRKKLCGKRFCPKIVEAVINDFKSRGLINDSLYAENFCHSRWSSSSWGPRRIKQALSSKGVSEVDAENAIQLVFQDGEKADGFRGSSRGMSKLSMDRLFVQASKQWLRGHDVPKETRKSRIIRWLQYRGFNWDVIGTIVKKLESNHPP